MSIPVVDPRRRHALECLSSVVRTVGDLKEFAVQEISEMSEPIVIVALMAANDERPPADDTVLTADFCRRMLAWLQTSTRVIDIIDALVAGDQEDSPQCAELAITLQALVQRLGQ